MKFQDSYIIMSLRQGNHAMLLPDQPIHICTSNRVGRAHRTPMRRVQEIKSVEFHTMRCKLYAMSKSIHACSTLNRDACCTNLKSSELRWSSRGIGYIHPYAQSKLLTVRVASVKRGLGDLSAWCSPVQESTVVLSIADASWGSPICMFTNEGSKVALAWSSYSRSTARMRWGY